MDTQPYYYWKKQWKRDYKDNNEWEDTYISTDVKQKIDDELGWDPEPDWDDEAPPTEEWLAKKRMWKYYVEVLIMSFWEDQVPFIDICMEFLPKSNKKILDNFYDAIADEIMTMYDGTWAEFQEVYSLLDEIATNTGKHVTVLKYLAKENYKKRYKAWFEPILIRKERIYDNKIRVELPSNLQGLDLDLKQQIDVISKKQDAITNIKYMLVDKNLYQMLKKAPDPSPQLFMFKVKIFDQIIEFIIKYSNIYVFTGILFVFIIILYYHFKKEIKNKQQQSINKISNKKKIKNNFKMIKRDYYTKSNKNNMKKRELIKPVASKQIISALLKSQQQIITKIKGSFSKKDFRLKFKIEAGNFYKSPIIDFRFKSEQTLNKSEKRELQLYVSKYNLVKKKYNENEALTALYDKYISLNTLNVSLYKYDNYIDISWLSLILNKKNRNFYNIINLNYISRDLQRSSFIKKKRHYINQQQNNNKGYFVLKYSFIKEYFNKIFRVIFISSIIFLLAFSLFINFLYLIAVFYLLPIYLLFWQGLYKSQSFLISFIVFCCATLLIILSIFCIILWLWNKVYNKSKYFTNKQIVQQYYFNLSTFKQILLKQVNQSNKNYSMFDLLIRDQTNKLITTFYALIRITIILSIILSILLIILLIIFATISFTLYSWAFIKYGSTSFANIHNVFIQNQILIAKVCQKLIWGGSQYDDLNMVDLLFNMQRNTYWNQWFDSQLIKWLANFRHQFWIENRLLVEKGIFYKYYLKTIDDYWFQDKPMVKRITKNLTYLQDLSKFFNDLPTYYNQFKTFSDPLRNRIININIWKQQPKGLMWRQMYLNFRTYNWQMKITQNPFLHFHLFKIMYDKMIHHILIYISILLILLFIIHYLYLRYKSKLMLNYGSYGEILFLLNIEDKKLGDIYILKYYILNNKNG